MDTWGVCNECGKCGMRVRDCVGWAVRMERGLEGMGGL